MTLLGLRKKEAGVGVGRKWGWDKCKKLHWPGSLFFHLKNGAIGPLDRLVAKPKGANMH